MASEAAAKKQKTSYARCVSSASSSRSIANEVVHYCYACKKEIPPRDLHIIDYDGGPNPIFIKPFHLDCVPIYYRDRHAIEDERHEELERKEKKQGPGYTRPKRIHWGRVCPRLINQPTIR